MGWKLPYSVLDLYSAYAWFANGRNMRNGGRSLLAAMSSFGLNSMEAEEKEYWRDMIIRLDWNEDQIIITSMNIQMSRNRLFTGAAINCCARPTLPAVALTNPPLVN